MVTAAAGDQTPSCCATDLFVVKAFCARRAMTASHNFFLLAPGFSFCTVTFPITAAVMQPKTCAVTMGPRQACAELDKQAAALSEAAAAAGADLAAVQTALRDIARVNSDKERSLRRGAAGCDRLARPDCIPGLRDFGPGVRPAVPPQDELIHRQPAARRVLVCDPPPCRWHSSESLKVV